MKEVNVTFKSNGKIQSIDADSIFLEEENLSVKVSASFPSDLTIDSVRAYIRTNSGVQSCVTPSFSDGKYSLTLNDDCLEKGILKIGFETVSSTAATRFSPIVLNVDGFISDDYIISKKLYTVSVAVADTETVDSSQNASVENVGSSKEVKLKFKIPKGEKGDKGDMPEVTDSLDSDSTTAALSANQGKVLNGLLSKKVTVYEAAESELDDLTDEVISAYQRKAKLYRIIGSKPGYVTNQWKPYYILAFTNGQIRVHRNEISYRIKDGMPPAWTEWVKLADSTDLEGKVDKVDGKGLSANDFTDAYKAVADKFQWYPEYDYLLTGYDIHTGYILVESDLDATGNINSDTDVSVRVNGNKVHYLSKKANKFNITTTAPGNTLLLTNETEVQLLSSPSASLTVTIPGTITIDYEAAFTFKSGETATMLTYSATPITWRGTDCDSDGDFTPQKNTCYEVSVKCLGFDADSAPVVVARVGAF